MTSFFKQLLVQWHALPNQRHKLQYAYLAVAFAVIVVAGVMAFFQPETGQALAGIGLILTGAFFLNGLVWALLRAFVEPYTEQLSRELRAAARPKSKK